MPYGLITTCSITVGCTTATGMPLEKLLAIGWLRRNGLLNSYRGWLRRDHESSYSRWLLSGLAPTTIGLVDFLRQPCPRFTGWPYSSHGSSHCTRSQPLFTTTEQRF